MLEPGVVARDAIAGQHDVVVPAAANSDVRTVQDMAPTEITLHRCMDDNQTILAQGPALQLFERSDPSLVIVGGFHDAPRC